LASRSALRIAISVNFSWDFNLYTEGMSGATRDFMTLQELINFDPVEPTYVSIKEFGAGTGNYGTNITPLRVATWLVEDNEKALSIVAGLNTKNATSRLEIDNIKAWANLGLYFAKKLRAAVANNQNKKSE
jgi:hypothetical protein